MTDSQRHVLTCRCILRQKREHVAPEKFKFATCSLIIDGTVVTSYTDCPNCGVTHKVIDICRSEIVTAELSQMSPSIDDLRASLPEKLVVIMSAYELDVSVWQHAVNIITHKLWGQFVQLKREDIGQDVAVKYVQILSESLFRVGTSVSSR